MAFTSTPLDGSSSPIPMSSAVPDGTNTPLAVEGGPIVNTGGNSLVPVSVWVKDGNDQTQGLKADTAVTNPALSASEIALLKGLLTDLNALLANSPALGQAAMSASTPVTIANNQSAVPVSGTVTATNPSVGTDGSTLPTSSTLIGASDGTNLQQLLVESSTNRNLRTGIFQGATEATVTGANALKVDNSAVTQPVSAASLPLPSGASTSAKQPALGTAGTASTDVLSVQGIASMTPLKTDGSGVTQPVSGTITANAGTNLNTSALALESGGHLASIDTHIPAQGQATMAASVPVAIASNQSNVPISGTVTANVGTTNGLALDTSVNGVIVSQGSTTSGEKGPLVQGAVTTAAPTYTTAQTSPISLTTAGAVRTDASATTQPVSGTVTANAGTGNFTVAQATGSNLHTVIDAGSAVIGSTTIQATSGTALQADQSNTELKVSAYVKTTTAGDTALTLGQATMANSLPVTIASNQSNIPANIAQIGGVSTQMSNNDGALPANMLATANYLYASGGPADSTGKPQQAALERMASVQGKAVGGAATNITATTAGDTALTFSSAPKTIMPGQKIQLSVGFGSPVETVLVTTSYVPSSTATSIPLQFAVVNSGNTTAKWDIFAPTGPAGAAMLPSNVPVTAMAIQDVLSTGQLYIASNAAADGQSAVKFIGLVPYLMNGSGTTDRQRNNTDNITLINAAAVSTTQTSADQVNYNGRGIKIWWNITTFGAALTLHIDYKDPMSGQYLSDVLTSAAISANTFTQYTIYPGITTTANVSLNDIVPRTWRVRVTGASTSSFTVGVSVIL